MKEKPSYPLTWLSIPPGPFYETQLGGSFILLSYISLYGNQQAKDKKKSNLKIKDYFFYSEKPLRQRLSILFCLGLIFFPLSFAIRCNKRKDKKKTLPQLASGFITISTASLHFYYS